MSRVSSTDLLLFNSEISKQFIRKVRVNNLLLRIVVESEPSRFKTVVHIKNGIAINQYNRSVDRVCYFHFVIDILIPAIVSIVGSYHSKAR